MKRILTLTLAAVLVFLAAAPVSAQDKTIKRKVAIGRFTNETQYGKGLFYDKENDPMRKQALDILSSKLAQSGKFILLEREDLDVLVAEVGTNMNKIGADYIILGSITQYGRKNEGHEQVFSSTKTQTVEAGVSVRLVEAATGLIIYSDEAKGYAETTSKQTLGIGGTAGFDATLSDKAISAALSQLVENIINKCMDKPWRSYLLAEDGGSYIIGGGASQGLAVGDKFNVYKKGRKVKNPQTGMEIELPGTLIGVVTVQTMMGDTPETEISFCSYSGQDIDENHLEDYYILDESAMKKLLLFLSAALLLTGCGVGSHTVVSGRADEAGIVFFADKSLAIDVTIDKDTYRVNTVKDSDFKSKRNIKRTAENLIVIKPGQHDVKVRLRGETILTQKIFVSAGDTKVINL